MGNEERFEVHPSAEPSCEGLCLSQHSIFSSSYGVFFPITWRYSAELAVRDFLNDSLNSYFSKHFLVGVYWNTSAGAGTDKKFSVAELHVSLHSCCILYNFSFVEKSYSFSRWFHVQKACLLLAFIGFLARACHLFCSFEILKFCVSC